MKPRITRGHSFAAGSLMSALVLAGLAAPRLSAAGEPAESVDDFDHSEARPGIAVNTGSRLLHLENSLRFEPIQPGSDPDRGRALFGLASDLETSDTSKAIFEGFSMTANKDIVSNGRTCFTCHRGRAGGLGLPAPPLSVTIPANDPIFTGVQADGQNDPDAPHNLDQFALIRYRPSRFNPQRPESDVFRKIFFWRKSPRLVNVAFTHGLLNDGRNRVMFETAKGAAFSHTQSGDDRFDDLFSLQMGNDIESFLFSQFSDPRLAALRDPKNPLHDVLTHDPFFTVPIHTSAERRGSLIFSRECMDCHNTPNVFNNMSNVMALGHGLSPMNPAFGPGPARTFNIGVSERNAHGLRFTEYTGSGYQPIVVPLVDAEGHVEQHEIKFDIGLAASTSRIEDIGRFKVPQLRGVKDAAPYFHDNSASTLEDAVAFHLSRYYQASSDGRNHPIHVSPSELPDLLAFLRAL